MLEIRPLAPDEWLTLRVIRLAALHDSPDKFLSTYEKERLFEDHHWRAEFDRGDWYIGFGEAEHLSLLGVTRDAETPDDACYLEYLWVDPGHRRRGVRRRPVRLGACTPPRPAS